MKSGIIEIKQNTTFPDILDVKSDDPIRGGYSSWSIHKEDIMKLASFLRSEKRTVYARCPDCDGKGHHPISPSSICPLCKGKGKI